MREVFAPSTIDGGPGRVFYTIREEDVGTAVIETTAGKILVSVCLGRVLPNDVGRRLYRRETFDGTGWTWQAESNKQRRERLGE